MWYDVYDCKNYKDVTVIILMITHRGYVSTLLHRNPRQDIENGVCVLSRGLAFGIQWGMFCHMPLLSWEFLCIIKHKPYQFIYLSAVQVNEMVNKTPVHLYR